MGIRFACPNGHPLHVKADLAGKRGICPECQVRFIIPTATDAAPMATATQAAPQRTAERALAPSTGESIVLPPQLPQPPAPANTADKSPSDAPAWYIRPATGGQFGPADDQLVRQWAAEGRVAADTYVWRSGWPDWRLAGYVPDYFPELASATQASSPPAAASDYNEPSALPDEQGTPSSDVSLATARYRRRKQRSARGQLLAAIALIVLAVILASVLVWVVLRTSASPEAETSPRSTPTTASSADSTQPPS